MNMLPRFAVDPGTDGNPNGPVCGYCNLVEADHERADHIFDAVGGSLAAIEPRNGPPPEFVHSSWEYAGKCLLIFLLGGACWYGAAVVFRATANAFDLILTGVF